MHRESFFRAHGSNKPFFWIILPLVVLGDLEIILGAAYILLLYFYSFLYHDFSLLLLTLVISTITFVLQLSEERYFRKFSYFALAPLFWFFMHLTIFVELEALIKARYTFYRKREVKWQKWQRTGVADS